MIIFLLLAVSLILRLINLNQSLWLDEAVQAITARESFSYIFQEIRGDFHPPLYFFLMNFWVRIFGDSEIALRLPSVLFGVGTVYILYKIATKIQGKFTAVLSTVLLATAPFHIYYSQEARMYCMVTFFASLSMYFFLTLNKSKNNRYLYFISTVLMIYSDYFGFLVLLAQGIYLIMKKNYKFLLVTCCWLLVAYLPWLPMLITQLKTGISATQTLPGWGSLVNVSFWKAIPLTVVKFTIGRITLFDKKLYVLAAAMIIFTTGALIIKGIYKNKKIQISNFKFQIFLWFFVPLTVSWLVSLFVPNFQPFRLLLILPAFYLLLAIGISTVNSNKLQFIVVGLFLIINLVCLSVYYFNPYFHREDWRGAVNFLLEQKRLVILPSETSNWPIRYYDRNNQVKLLSIGRGVEEIEKVGKIEEQNVFFINYLTDVFDPNGLIVSKLKEEGYNKTNEISFNQISLWEYQE